uniref:Sterile alpha motif domain-containing protein 9-like n=1 Tax=Cyclopterus lumpus TaxID=8103 RepID=A0A8C2Z656_CYCLU
MKKYRNVEIDLFNYVLLGITYIYIFLYLFIHLFKHLFLYLFICNVDPERNTQLTIMELTPMERADIYEYLHQNPMATNTQLFSFLALLNAYVPESYLLMSECLQILGPPDPIHGVPFEERVEPFSLLIKRSGRNPEHVCIIPPLLAQQYVTLLAKLGISRTATVKNLMFSLCGDWPQPHVLQFIRYLLTKRKPGKKGKDKFSRLIEDILGEGSFYNAVSVLKTASNKLRQNSIYPQTLSRLYYIRGGVNDYEKAERWAKTAIERAENNSYVADTLGQVYKNWLRKARQPNDIQQMENKAFDAFKEVERKADNEEGPEMSDMDGTLSISDSFNNRGLFGFIQVAKIAFEKLRALRSPLLQEQIPKLKMEVQAKFDFFERYLTYSKPTATSAEPHYFWKDIALCYEMYTTASAAESTSFPGLLDGLSRGLFTSRGRRAGFKEAEKTASDLKEIRDVLKNSYEANPDDVQAAESYILSNITLSNESRHHTPVKELQAIMHRFLHTDVGRRSPEFYLMALLLFWPEEEPQLSEGESLEYVEFMETSFERSDAKYLRGRYLSPLFFLGEGSGLSRWIHKSRLDEIEKWKRINKKWTTGDVWRIPEIEEMLLPVRVEPGDTSTKQQEEEKVLVCAGRKRIRVTKEAGPDSGPSPVLFYLGFNIKGPVVFQASGQ